MRKESFIKAVRKELKGLTHDSYIRSTCPLCFGLPLISNDHRCENGWNAVLDRNPKDVAKNMKNIYEQFEKIKQQLNHSKIVKN